MEGNDKARNTIMIRKDIEHKRIKKYEDHLNSTTVVKNYEGINKWRMLMKPVANRVIIFSGHLSTQTKKQNSK